MRRLTWMVILLCGGLCVAEDAAKQSDKVVEHWLGVAQEMASKQTVFAKEEPGRPFVLREKAVFRHTQSVRGGDDIGAIYVWTSESGRPGAIGVFFAWSQEDHRWVMQEFHSLYDKPIKKTVPDQTTWTCTTPGLEWHDGLELATNSEDPRRLRLLAKQLPRKLKVRTKSFDEQDWQLRFVPTPFYEYKVPDEDVIYGAIFGYCQGTDTELLVVVEVRKTDDKLSWQYALAPFSDYTIYVDLPDGGTWKSPDGKLNENGKPHFWSFVEKRPKPEFEK